MKVRRVVTGQNADGKSVFVSDEEVDAITLDLLPGYEFHRLWGSDVASTLPTDGQPPPAPAYFPPATGYRFGFFTVAPAGVDLPADLDVEAALAEMETQLPGMAAHMEPDDPGMHTTDTVDFEVVLSRRGDLRARRRRGGHAEEGRHVRAERHATPLAQRRHGAGGAVRRA